MFEEATESQKQEFFDLAMKLLERDGEYTDLGEEGFILSMMVNDLRLGYHGGVRVLDATLPSEIPGMRVQVFADEPGDYSGPLIEEWTPKLRSRLILEELAGA